MAMMKTRYLLKVRPALFLFLAGLFFLPLAPFISQERQYRFDYFSVEHGLTSVQVLCMMEDKMGFLWFGTMKGLVRYDGYNFRVYALATGDSASLSDPVVTCLLEDRQGYLWACLLCFLLIAGIVRAVFRFRLRRKLSRLEARRLRELDHFKTRFYTNITHEFRGPLTLILGPITNSLQKNEPLTADELSVAQQNGERLLKLINQILDLSKLDAGALDAHYIQADVIPFLRYLVRSFHSLAQSRHINLKFSADVEQFVIDFDKDKLETIVVNLVSNAVKYTPDGGEAGISVVCSDERYCFVVRDTGAGIPREELPFIFDRFYHVDRSGGGIGTGIGLALARELVELMGGKIEVESEVGEGTVFTVTLPVRHTAPIEKVEAPLISEVCRSAAYAEKHPVDNHKTSILIIEDHPEAAQYAAACLGAKFNVLFASDGAQGLKSAFEVIPDLIICDVIMPEKDGFEVCKILKHDERSSHIPIIMLSAKADAGSRLEGLVQGADAYVFKPFSEAELRVRVENLLEQRRRLQARYRNPGAGAPADEVSPRENAFLQRLRSIAEARLDDHTFTVEAFARAAGMSQAQFHRKLTALTGHSAGHFIQALRLQKARELLRAADLNISEIAYDCGFGSPAHFTRVFKEAFGVSPTDFRASLRK